MCTVSWFHHAEGYVLLCNRDERHSRKQARGPRVSRTRAVSFVAPVDGDHGGSWIGANQFGLTLCLLNRYGDWTADPDRDYRSRGLLLRDLLDCRHSEDVSKRLKDIELDRFRPFSMLALARDEAPMLVEWNGDECATDLDTELRIPLTSSSLRDTNVLAVRRNVFAEMISQSGGLDAGLLRQFHGSHLPERGPYSVCMHRDDAATVSLSMVTVTRDTVSFVYHPNSPCRQAVAESRWNCREWERM